MVFPSSLLGDTQHAGRSQTLKVHILWSHHQGKAFGHSEKMPHQCTARSCKSTLAFIWDVTSSVILHRVMGCFPTFPHNIILSFVSIEMCMKNFLVGKSKLEDKITIFSKPQEPIIQRRAILWHDRRCTYMQCIPLATEPGISLIILPLMRILLLRVATIRRTTDTFFFISHKTKVLLFKFRCNIFIVGFGCEWDTL